MSELSDQDLKSILASKPSCNLQNATFLEYTTAIQEHFRVVIRDLSDSDLFRMVKLTNRRWKKMDIFREHRLRHPDIYVSPAIDDDDDDDY